MKAQFRGYKFMIQWIAYNDEAEDTNVATVSELISVQLVADSFSFPTEKVAYDVVKIRKAANKEKV